MKRKSRRNRETGRYEKSEGDRERKVGAEVSALRGLGREAAGAGAGGAAAAAAVAEEG
ncbi:hypothetical protein K0M31_004062 [Melipona bicolor]|uniref:Uncharacterized protein n=1 Tax=Melipona bicolor TaxID=60889 RepID=A0AA40KP74_9HYME|nr:hypothetical protein K0M31_004062 [Melipona bicolor]